MSDNLSRLIGIKFFYEMREEVSSRDFIWLIRSIADKSHSTVANSKGRISTGVSPRNHLHRARHDDGWWVYWNDGEAWSLSGAHDYCSNQNHRDGISWRIAKEKVEKAMMCVVRHGENWKSAGRQVWRLLLARMTEPITIVIVRGGRICAEIWGFQR